MSDLNLAVVCDRALAFHDEARAQLDALGPAVRSTAQNARLQAPWAHFERELREHFAEEESVLFPALRALAAGEDPGEGPWRAQLDELSRELDEVRTIADALRSAARDAGPLELSLLELLDGLEAHAQAEAEVLLPAARTALQEEAAPVQEETAPVQEETAPAPVPASPERGRLRRLGHRLRELLRGRS